MGADSGGERAAAMYSLVGSARLSGIDAQGYLRYVLTHIADHPVNRWGALSSLMQMACGVRPRSNTAPYCRSLELLAMTQGAL